MEFTLSPTYPHQPLISALTTFYTLLVDLCYIPASCLSLPLVKTGSHPPRSINHRAASRHGFSNEVIDLTYRIPYLTDDDYKIHGETNPLCYLVPPGKQIPGDEDEYNPLEQEEGEEQWEYAKDPTYQERDDLFKNRNALVLTRGNAYGTELIYDLDKCTITAWNHFTQSDYWTDEPSYSMTSVHNPLYVWINHFLTLEYIPFEGNLIVPLPLEAHGYPGNNPSEEEMEQWREGIKRHEKERGLKNVYIECGWKTDAANSLGINSKDDGKNVANEEQDRRIWEKLEQAREMARNDFQGNVFVEKRKKYMKRIYTESS
ncbi:hypothetical protein B7463_g9607, partial [Scytalidium lignicola]